MCAPADGDDRGATAAVYSWAGSSSQQAAGLIGELAALRSTKEPDPDHDHGCGENGNNREYGGGVPSICE
jgi:hypothetical protein